MTWRHLLFVCVMVVLLDLQITDSSMNLRMSFIEQSVASAVQNVTDRRRLLDTAAPPSGHQANSLVDSFATLRLPATKAAIDMFRAAEVFELVISAVKASKGELNLGDIGYIGMMAGCSEDKATTACNSDFHNRYRSIDGTCNNLGEPTWGSTLIRLRRLLAPIYEDEFTEPPGWNASRLYHGYPLPSARRVSTVLVATHAITVDEDYTHMLMLWGQFHDHDVTFIPTANANCGGGMCANQPPCFPIPVPDDDPRIHTVPCLPFTRSAASCDGLKTGLREQVNQITAYIDASNVYGSDVDTTQRLRDFEPNVGNLRIGILSAAGKPYMPFDMGNEACLQVPGEDVVPCFLAGDKRGNEHIGLAAMHTIWIREHNRLADELRLLNPHYSGDAVFNETRKILGAKMQVITYEEFLPKIIGPVGMDILGPYSGYKKDVDASIINSFAGAAYRFGHGMVLPVAFRLDDDLKPIPEGNLPLHKTFFTPHLIVNEGGIDPILRGTIGVGNKGSLPTEIMSDELTEFLFALANTIALDLGAMNTQRGRDHGLPTYNAFREHCGFSRADTFDDLKEDFSSTEALRRLESVYGHPDNIDLFIGGMAEDLAPGARVGPTFQCLIAEQFKVSRDGDRFWYENPDVFSGEQRAELRKTRLARALCDNGDDIRRVQDDVFMVTPDLADWKPCAKIPQMDLEPWKEEELTEHMVDVVTTYGCNNKSNCKCSATNCYEQKVEYCSCTNCAAGYCCCKKPAQTCRKENGCTCKAGPKSCRQRHRQYCPPDACGTDCLPENCCCKIPVQ